MNLKNIRQGWSNYVLSKISEANVAPELKKLAKMRVDVCMNCDKLYKKSRKDIFGATKSSYKCLECGCSFPAMVWAPSKHCPIGKWEK